MTEVKLHWTTVIALVTIHVHELYSEQCGEKLISKAIKNIGNLTYRNKQQQKKSSSFSYSEQS